MFENEIAQSEITAEEKRNGSSEAQEADVYSMTSGQEPDANEPESDESSVDSETKPIPSSTSEIPDLEFQEYFPIEINFDEVDSMGYLDVTDEGEPGRIEALLKNGKTAYYECVKSSALVTLYNAFTEYKNSIEEAKSDPSREVETIDIEEDLTEEDLINIANEQNELISEIEFLMAEETAARQEANRNKKTRDEKTERLIELKKKYNAGTILRTLTCDIFYDWDNGTKNYIHPKTGETVQSVPIPRDKYQLRIEDFENSTIEDEPEEPEETEESLFKEQLPKEKCENLWDYMMNYDGLNLPRGVTEKRLNDHKDEILYDEEMQKHLKEFDNCSGAKDAQDVFISVMHDIAKGILLRLGVIK